MKIFRYFSHSPKYKFMKSQNFTVRFGRQVRIEKKRQENKSLLLKESL